MYIYAAEGVQLDRNRKISTSYMNKTTPLSKVMNKDIDTMYESHK